MKQAYERWNPRGQSKVLVQLAEEICEDYAAQGYDLTLRQLYYQFVARDHIGNTAKNYKMLGNVIDRARCAGLLDWNHIVDRTRNLMGYTTYDDPSSLIAEQEYRYHEDVWFNQGFRPEVWVEKEALAGVVSRAALGKRVNYFSCRGYVSQSEMHAAAMRHRGYERQGDTCIVLHLGDHDPSGIDMSRDIQERLRFFGANTRVHRIALTYDQVLKYDPPPNPAKTTDSRFESYAELYGDESWELDALNPQTLNDLILEGLKPYLDEDRFEEALRMEEDNRKDLRLVAENWDTAVDAVRNL